jgi:hypothetical protein
MEDSVVISGYVAQTKGKGIVESAEVQLFSVDDKGTPMQWPLDTQQSDANGYFAFEPQPDADYVVSCRAFRDTPAEVHLKAGEGAKREITLNLGLDFQLALYAYGEGDTRHRVSRAVAGRPLIVAFEAPDFKQIASITWTTPHAVVIESERERELQFTHPGKAVVRVAAVGKPQASIGNASGPAAGTVGVPPTPPSAPPRAPLEVQFIISPPELSHIAGHVGVTLHRTDMEPTLDQALWAAIRCRTHAISFHRYQEFMNRVLGWEENRKLPERIERRLRDLGANLHGVGAYQVLKTATEVFLLLNCGVRIDRECCEQMERDQIDRRSRVEDHENHGSMAERLREYLGHPPQLPYITRVVETAFPEYEHSSIDGHGLLINRINEPCLLELIWSYWMEEGMLMQTINAISRRFQNLRLPEGRDPLANFELDPLRPVNNLLWGYVQDELSRLSVRRRAAEYEHEYDLQLIGKATHGLRTADVRSKFLEAFHNLLYKTSVFYKEDFQTTVIADGYPLLNALKEVHLILAQGAHNQFGDLPWTARGEMLLTQFLLARPEIREFLQSRAMVPYIEAWMPQVDAMNTLQGWTDIPVTHFRDLAVYGEQLLLSVRYGDWMAVDNENSAKAWARDNREAVMKYMAAYRAVTGVDLTNPDTVNSTMPGILLQRRLSAQHRAR